MTKFQVGDLVKVRVKAEPYRQYKDKVGHIINMAGPPKYLWGVDFNGLKMYLAEDELEKI